MKYRQLIAMIVSDGWVFERQAGSHIQYRHPTKLGTVTVAAGGKLNRDVPVGTANSVLKQAGLK